MHVDVKDFSEILDRNTHYRMSGIIEKLAESIHEDWRKGAYQKSARLDVPFSELSPVDKEDNRAAARRIPDVLALVGLGLATADDAKSMEKPAKDKIARYIETHVDRLAEAEHDGWMSQRAKNGWTYGTSRDDDKKFHPLMIPYSKFPDPEREKDRTAVRRYAANVEAAGFVIVWLSGESD